MSDDRKSEDEHKLKGDFDDSGDELMGALDMDIVYLDKVGPTLNVTDDETASVGQAEEIITVKRLSGDDLKVRSKKCFFDNYESDEPTKYEQKLKNLKRIFPGPAGLLPQLTAKEIQSLDNPQNPLSQEIAKIINADLAENQLQQVEEVNTPERMILRMSKAPYRELLKVIDSNPKDSSDILNIMNAKWVNRYIRRYPIGTKIPFLALVVQEDPDAYRTTRKYREVQNPNVKFMDQSGTILVSFDVKFLEVYGKEIVPGTTMALNNIPFITTRHDVGLIVRQKHIICMTYMKQPNPDEKYGNTEKRQRMEEVRKETHKNEVEVITSAGIVCVHKFMDFDKSKITEEMIFMKSNIPAYPPQEDKPNPGLFSTTRVRNHCQPIPSSSKTRKCPQAEDSMNIWNDEEDDEILKAAETVDSNKQ